MASAHLPRCHSPRSSMYPFRGLISCKQLGPRRQGSTTRCSWLNSELLAMTARQVVRGYQQLRDRQCSVAWNPELCSCEVLPPRCHLGDLCLSYQLLILRGLPRTSFSTTPRSITSISKEALAHRFVKNV